MEASSYHWALRSILIFLDSIIKSLALKCQRSRFSLIRDDFIRATGSFSNRREPQVNDSSGFDV